MSEQQQKRVVTNEEMRPCGCHVVHYGETKELSPCPPCGLVASAQSLGQAAQAMDRAAQALAAVATRMRVEMGRADVAAAARAVAQSKILGG